MPQCMMGTTESEGFTQLSNFHTESYTHKQFQVVLKSSRLLQFIQASSQYYHRIFISNLFNVKNYLAVICK